MVEGDEVDLSYEAFALLKVHPIRRSIRDPPQPDDRPDAHTSDVLLSGLCARIAGAPVPVSVGTRIVRFAQELGEAGPLGGPPHRPG